MRRAPGIRVMTGILVICFLFTSIIPRPSCPIELNKNSSITWVKTRAEGHPKSCHQLLDEEAGEEKSEKDVSDKGDYRCSDVGFPIYSHEVTLVYEPQDLLGWVYDEAQHDFCGKDVPSYLANHSLLI